MEIKQSEQIELYYLLSKLLNGYSLVFNLHDIDLVEVVAAVDEMKTNYKIFTILE